MAARIWLPFFDGEIFKFAESTLLIRDEETGKAQLITRFPGYRFVAAVTSLAWEMKKWPSEIYDRLAENPYDVLLLMGWQQHIIREQKKAEEKAKNQPHG